MRGSLVWRLRLACQDLASEHPSRCSALELWRLNWLLRLLEAGLWKSPDVVTRSSGMEDKLSTLLPEENTGWQL